MEGTVRTIAKGELPPGVEEVQDELCIVPFGLLTVAPVQVQSEDGRYHWCNPRRLGSLQGVSLGQGFDEPTMQDLYVSIRESGLLAPLLCRWLHDTNGKLVLQVIDGERRFICLREQVAKDEMVFCRHANMKLPATEVHKGVLCRAMWGLENDEDALSMAMQSSESAVSWGDAALTKLVKHLRGLGWDDEKILAKTHKSPQWLRDTDLLIGLDDVTFSYLAGGRITRNGGLKLVRVSDVNRRHRFLHTAYDFAVAHHKDELNKADKALRNAEDREEVADAALATAAAAGQPTGELKERLTKAKARTQTKREERAAAAKPQVKAKDLRAAANSVAAEDGVDIDAEMAQMLRSTAVKQQLTDIQSLISNEARDEAGKTVFNVDILRVVVACYKAILLGEEDIIKVLRREYVKFTILEKRHHDEPEEILMDMDDFDDDEDDGEDEDEEYEGSAMEDED